MSNNKLWISALGLDIGLKRVGIAGCDGTGLIATGITTLVRSSFDRDVAYLRELVRERRVEILVAGLPYSLNGELGAQARQVQKYANRIATALELPLEYVDERLTSVEAEELMKTQGISLSQNKGAIDRKAAALILQQWLDERRQNISALPNP
ncbi:MULTISPECIES: Holliday junction resolvase RuvX [unclassified Microcoleus]|uniref:Holliday junction resolvase RuvX n=1 Tax=unclassified Microcoleus TaxID=2642155 RepID=UPI002FD608AF